MDSLGRLAPMATKASPVTSYSKVTQSTFTWWYRLYQFGHLYRVMRGNQTLKFFKYSWRHSEPAEEGTSASYNCIYLNFSW